jgi:hypothetical protein
MPNRTVDAAMQAIINARVEAIEQAHANNLIEGLDAGTDWLSDLLARAREPVTDEEFTRREEVLWRQEYSVENTLAA